MKVRVEYKINGRRDEPEIGSDAYGAVDFADTDPGTALVEAAQQIVSRNLVLEPGTHIELLILQRPG